MGRLPVISFRMSSPSRPTSASAPAWMLLWALSGFSMLTLETVWMREIALRAGNTVMGSTLVIVVFFGFAALGNLFGARLVSGSDRPLRLYACCESAAAMTAVLTFVLGRWLWSHLETPAIALSHPVVSAVLLAGLPSFLSGAAFPSLTEAFVSSPAQRTASAGRFYGMNLLGASLGVAAGAVWLPWWLGVKAAFSVAAAVQLSCGLIALWMAAGTGRCEVKKEEVRPPSVPAWLGWAVLTASGVFSLAAQTLLIVWVRQVLEGSVYATAAVLVVFIGGLGLGSLAAGSLRRRGHPASRLLALFAGTGGLLLFLAPLHGTSLCLQNFALTAATPSGMMWQALCDCAVLLPLTFALGGVFPVSWELVSAHAAGEGRVLGLALAANKLGAAAGTALALFALLPAAGLAHGTHVIAWGYLLLAWLPTWLADGLKTRCTLGLGIIAVFGAWQTMQPEPALGVTSQLRLIDSSVGAYGPSLVVEDTSTGSRQILLNTRQRLSGTRAALSSQQHQSWVPLLFCRKPGRVVTIGMAAGISAAAALDAPLTELHSIELVPEVVQAAREHFSEWNAALFSDPRSHIHIGDGRQQLAQLPGGFDAIICDLFFPAEEGSALLYSRDFFESSRHKLTPGGVFCLWLPCYQHTPQTAGTIIRTFTDVFPHAIAVRANLDPLAPVIGLIGASEPLPLSSSFLTARLGTSWAMSIPSPFFRSADHALLLLVCDLHSAEPSFGDFPPITDDHPLLAWLGPRQPSGKERLHGFPFLDWIGRRALNARFPSCDLGTTTSEHLLNAIRAGNFHFAASAANVVLPDDRRPETLRSQQVQGYLQRAAEILPGVAVPFEALGR
jgi:spermidine synthase